MNKSKFTNTVTIKVSGQSADWIDMSGKNQNLSEDEKVYIQAHYSPEIFGFYFNDFQRQINHSELYFDGFFNARIYSNKSIITEIRKHFQGRFVIILNTKERTKLTSGSGYCDAIKNALEQL